MNNEKASIEEAIGNDYRRGKMGKRSKKKDVTLFASFVKKKIREIISKDNNNLNLEEEFKDVLKNEHHNSVLKYVKSQEGHFKDKVVEFLTQYIKNKKNGIQINGKHSTNPNNTVPLAQPTTSENASLYVSNVPKTEDVTNSEDIPVVNGASSENDFGLKIQSGQSDEDDECSSISSDASDASTIKARKVEDDNSLPAGEGDQQGSQPENPVLTPIATDSDERDSSSDDVSDTTGTLADQSTEYITPQTSDTPDSSSDEEDNHQLESEDNPQLEVSANDTSTVDDDVSSLSSDEHSSASSNAGDVSTTEDITDNEEPVVTTTDSKEGNDQLTGEGDSKSPVTFIIEGNDNKVVIEQDNSVKTHPQSTKSSKLSTVATWTFAVAGILAGAAAPAAYFAFSVSLLTTGIIAGVGACCLVAAVIIYCCNRPSSSFKGSNVELIADKELAATVS